MFREPVREEMFKAAGMLYPLSLDQLHSKEYHKVIDAWNGFAEFSRIQDSDADVAYNGTTVGPSDKEKVLLRWKLDDGKYQVIFGDLRAEIATVDRLHVLEGK
jgi:hypothetical protein